MTSERTDGGGAADWKMAGIHFESLRLGCVKGRQSSEVSPRTQPRVPQTAACSCGMTRARMSGRAEGRRSETGVILSPSSALWTQKSRRCSSNLLPGVIRRPPEVVTSPSRCCRYSCLSGTDAVFHPRLNNHPSLLGVFSFKNVVFSLRVSVC